MKRQNSDEAVASGDNKRQRGGYNDALVEGKFELRFLVPTRCAGPAIGRKGETINAIRQQVCLFFNAIETLTSTSNISV